MSWYKKVIAKNKKEIASSAAFAVVFALAILLWHFWLGKTFQWATINPIEAPSFFNRVLYSALVFVTFGAFLYWVRFYQFLYHLIVRGLGDRQLYRGIKGLIWGFLILIMYFWVVPKVVELLNAIISFLYNILNLVLYLFPPLGASLIVFSIGYILFQNHTKGREVK
ncbi:MAG: hypothetical protein PHC85_01040 [Candidatus Pacebacteria bacterium]|nr:hypothetical protein [Candidatus Paceibacterota bacterium]